MGERSLGTHLGVGSDVVLGQHDRDARTILGAAVAHTLHADHDRGVVVAVACGEVGDNDIGGIALNLLDEALDLHGGTGHVGAALIASRGHGVEPGVAAEHHGRSVGATVVVEGSILVEVGLDILAIDHAALRREPVGVVHHVVGGGKDLALILGILQSGVEVASHARAVGARLGGKLLQQHLALEAHGDVERVVGRVDIGLATEVGDVDVDGRLAIDGAQGRVDGPLQVEILTRGDGLVEGRGKLLASHGGGDGELVYGACGLVEHRAAHGHGSRRGVEHGLGTREGQVILRQVIAHDDGLYADGTLSVAVAPEGIRGALVVEGTRLTRLHDGEGRSAAALLQVEADVEALARDGVGRVELHDVPALLDARVRLHGDVALGQVLTLQRLSHPDAQRVDVGAGAQSHADLRHAVALVGFHGFARKLDRSRYPSVAFLGGHTFTGHCALAIAQRQRVRLSQQRSYRQKGEES